MKTIKVTIPGKPRGWRIKKTGEPCEIRGLNKGILTVDGELTHLAITSGRTMHVKASDFEATEPIPVKVLTYHVPEINSFGRPCKHLPIVTDCKPHIHPCRDCIYHYLATL